MSAPDLSPAARVFAALLEARTGQQIGANRAYRIEPALKPLMKVRGVESLDALAGRITLHRDAALADEVVAALLNGETSFFRDAAAHDLAVELLEAARAQAPCGRARLWSAGCSTGQEPLSLAMLLAERGTAPVPEIVATDVSAAAVARARVGSFSQFEIQRGLPVQRMMRWFDTVGGNWVARPELLARVAVRCHNLVSDPPLGGRFDVILCRNVLLYFSPEHRRRVFARLAAALRPDGALLLGAGETVIGQTDLFVQHPDHRGAYRLAAPQPLAERRAHC